MPITTKVVSSNPIRSKVYSIQYYVIKFVSDCYNITEILLKVALNAITLTLHTPEAYISPSSS